MSEFLDELARALAKPMPRSRALRLVGGAFVYGAIPGLRSRWPAAARAYSAGATPTRRAGECFDEGPYQPFLFNCRPHTRTPGPVCEPSPVAPVPDCCDDGEKCCTDGPRTLFGNGYYCCPTSCECSKGRCCPPGAGCIDKCCASGQTCCLSAASRSHFCCRSGGCCGSKCCSEHEECEFDANNVPRCVPVCVWHELNRTRRRRYDPARECCTRYGVTDKYPIRQFAWCEDTRVPHKGHKPTANGCGTKDHPVPNRVGRANFKPACDAHDLCYETCGKPKAACDERFCTAVKAACRAAYRRGTRGLSACLDRADDYCLGGSLGATLVGAYDDAQSKACDCC